MTGDLLAGAELLMRHTGVRVPGAQFGYFFDCLSDFLRVNIPGRAQIEVLADPPINRRV